MGNWAKHWKDVLTWLFILVIITIVAVSIWRNGWNPDEDRRNMSNPTREEVIEKKVKDWTPLMP